MKRKKALRRHCDLTACGKLYRYSKFTLADLFPDLPEEALSGAHKKAADQVAQEQSQAWADATAAAMSATGDGRAAGELNPKYQKAYDGMHAQKQQSRANKRRGGGRRRDDLKGGAYKMPQIVIEQEPSSSRRRVG